MPGCVGISYTTGNGYDVIPFSRTQRDGVWNELETTDFVDSIPKLNPVAGEKEGFQLTTLGLTRRVNGRQQRILISGDADWLGNGEISKFRSGVPIINEFMSQGCFFWLSNNETPVDVRRVAMTDNFINMKISSLGLVKIILIWIIPALLLAACLVIWIRRKRR